MIPNPHAIPLFSRVFYYLRHGETTSNRDRTIAGSLDVELTDAGRTQARTAVALIAPLGITAVSCSSLRRARDTAAIIANALKLTVTPIAELNERNWGKYEGKPRALRIRGMTPPGAETPQQYVERTVRGLAGIPPSGVPLIAAHSGTYRVLCRLIGHEEGLEPIANCHPVRIAPADGTWRVEML